MSYEPEYWPMHEPPLPHYECAVEFIGGPLNGQIHTLNLKTPAPRAVVPMPGGPSFAYRAEPQDSTHGRPAWAYKPEAPKERDAVTRLAALKEARQAIYDEFDGMPLTSPLDAISRATRAVGRLINAEEHPS